MKIKAKIKKNKVIVKILMKSPMIGKEEAHTRKVEVNFITHMIASVNSNIVWEASTGPFLSKNPYMQFALDTKTLNIVKGDELNVSFVDNKGQEYKGKKAIK